MTYVYEINGVRKEFIYNLHYIVFTVDNVPANNEGAMVEIDKNEKAYLCYRNEQGYLYFEYQDHTVFCKNAINVLTPEEFIRFAYGDDADFAYKCNNGKPLHVIASEELCKTLQKYGLESIYVRINESPLRYEGWKENKKIFEKCLLYLDPPYFNKGNQLYTNHYKYQDHAKIAKCVNRLKGKWIVSYDNTPEIIDLYKFVESNNIREFNIAYSAAEGKNKKGKEIMFFAPKSIIPQCKIC